MLEDHAIFFAYPQSAHQRREAIVAASSDIGGNPGFSCTTWESLRGSGRLLISKVISAIDDADVFACDLTRFNENVLFELGYAMGARKSIWILRDVSDVVGNHEWKSFKRFCQNSDNDVQSGAIWGSETAFAESDGGPLDD